MRKREIELPGERPLVGLLAVALTARVLAHISLLSASVIRPLTPVELNVPAWPPAPPFFQWVGRVCFAPFERWDVVYYLRIAAQGYSLDDGTLQFHPLFPVVARPLISLGLSPLLALFTVQTCSFLCLVAVFYQLARLDLSPRDASFCVLGLILSPFAFALMIPYSEATFLFLVVLSVFWARTDRWWRAGLAGVLATLTRQQGLFLVLPLGWLAWISSGGCWDAVVASLRNRRSDALMKAFAVSCVPIAYLVWTVYRGIFYSDIGTGVSSFHDLVYTFLISPQSARVVPVQSFQWPWVAAGNALIKLVEAPDLDLLVNLVGGVWFLLMLVLVWRHLDQGYRIYVLSIALVSFAYYTGPAHPYMGLIRHLLLGFPVFLGLGRALRSDKSRRLCIGLQSLGMYSLLFLYGLHAWVP